MLEDEDEWQSYNNSYKSGNDRRTQIGPCFQVNATAIPSVPSLLNSGGKADEKLERANQLIESRQVWDPDRLP